MTTRISGQGQWGRKQRLGNWLSSKTRKSYILGHNWMIWYSFEELTQHNLFKWIKTKYMIIPRHIYIYIYMNVWSVNGWIYKYFRWGKQVTIQLLSGFKTTNTHRPNYLQWSSVRKKRKRENLKKKKKINILSAYWLLCLLNRKGCYQFYFLWG